MNWFRDALLGHERRELRIARYDCALMKSMGIDYSELRDVCWLYQEHQLLQDLRLEMMNLEVVQAFYMPARS